MKFAPHAVLQFLCYDIFIQKGIRVAIGNPYTFLH